MLRLLGKLLPLPLKRMLAERLRPYLCPPPPPPPEPPPPRPLADCKPGSPNIWWNELEALPRARPLFPALGEEASKVCAEIREAYRPVLEEFGIQPDDFFWGSIKNQEAEMLYQLVRERKPALAYQVGTFAGYSALVIAHALRANDKGLLIATDPEVPHRSFVNPVDVARRAAETQGVSEFLRFERGWHSATLGDYTGMGLKREIPVVGPALLESVRDQGIDFAFIDGDHSTTCTLSDFMTLKDYLNVGGVVVFHDVHSWPSVAQALFVLWHDIHYFVRGMSAYFALDLRRGEDGLAALERIGLETFPTLRVKVRDAAGNPVNGARVRLPCLNIDTPVDREGAMYVLQEVPAGSRIQVEAEGFPAFEAVLEQGTLGDYREFIVVLEGGAPPAEPGELELPPSDWPLPARMEFHAGEMPDKGLAARVADLPIQRGGLPVHYPDPETFNEDTLRELLAALPPEGGTLYLPPGRIEFNRSLNLPSQVHLIGSPGTELIFNAPEFGMTLIGDEINPVAGVRLENLTLRHPGGEGPHPFTAALYVSRARDLVFHRVEIHSPRGTGFLLADQVRRVRMEQCAVYYAALAGFTLFRDVADCLLDHCVAERCLQSGIFLSDLKLPAGCDPSDFETQVRHTLFDIGNFGPFAPSDPCPQRNTLQNCVFSRNRKMGITTDGVGNLRVINCVIAENDCEGITLDNGTWGCEVRDCHVYANGWRGLQHEAELTADYVARMGLMPDGGSKAKLPGISLDNAAHCRIEHNLIEHNWGDGVKFVRAAHACVVAGNFIAHNNRGANEDFHFFGVLLGVAERQHPEQSDFPACHNQIVDNDILGAHYAGIHLLAATRDNLLRANRICGAHLSIENHADSRNRIE